MKFLSLHCDYIKFKPLKKALNKIGVLSNKEKKGEHVKEALAIMTAVEKKDSNIKEIVDKFVVEIKDIAKQVNAKNIVIYPYAHLSSDLAAPEVAMDVLSKAEKELKKIFKVFRAPFGYYKEFEMKVKGHPLSELSREVSVEGKKGEEVEEKYNAKHLLNEISKHHLDTSKLKQNDHRIIGQKLDLFSFNDSAPGMVFWHNNGLIIYNELMNFMRAELKNENYQEIRTPEILDKRLWQISGHWEKYKENIFLTEYDKRIFAVKPMNCPGDMLVYKSKPKSYKDFPLRIAEFGLVHRQELSGVLGGIFRVIQFTQDDAHIFCSEKQAESELLKCIKLIEKVYDKFGFTYRIELSTRPKKRIGSDKMWDKSEKILESVLKKNKIKYKLNPGDGAFYGPKIDFHIKDSLGRSWQLGTIQFDFSMPERFDLAYTDKDNKIKRPVMIHRAILGSLERFIGILLENLNGALPTWLSPIQARVINFTNRNKKESEKLLEKLKNQGIRVDCDFTESTVQSKVRNAELMKIPYIIVIGDKEEKSKTIAVRPRGKKPEFGVKIDGFISKLKKEIKERT